MADGSDWLLPSQSRRVRMVLYLAEGMIIGAFLSLFLLKFSGAFLIDVETGSFEMDLSTFELYILSVSLFFTFVVAMFLKGNLDSSRDGPPEYRDWKVTRKWKWVFLLAFPIGTLLLSVSVFLWGWWEVIFLNKADIVMLGTIIAGFLIHAYVLHRIGIKII